jgi:hypothetical protein
VWGEHAVVLRSLAIPLEQAIRAVFRETTNLEIKLYGFADSNPCGKFSFPA